MASGTLLLSGMAGAWSPLVLGCFCMAGARFGAPGPTFAWQCSTLTLWALLAGAWSPLVLGCFCMASATSLAWQVQHSDFLGTGGGRLVAAGPRLLFFTASTGATFLRGRRSILCSWRLLSRGSRSTLLLPDFIFAWQVQHLGSPGTVGARLVAAGPRLLLRGLHCGWQVCVAGTKCGASGTTFAWQVQHFAPPAPHFAWQVQHFHTLGTGGIRLVAAGPRLLLGRRNNWCFWSTFRMAGAALCCSWISFSMARAAL